MEEFREMNWSEVARAAIKEKIAQLRFLESIAAKSKLSEEEAIKLSVELGRKLKKSMHERFKKEHPKAY